MRDVGALAGVSLKTVSRVVNGDRYVSAEVRERVQRAIDELHYVPNLLAQSFRTGRDTAIGVAIPSLTDPFFGEVAQAATAEATALGTAVLITQLGATPDEERTAVEALLQRQVSGMLIAPVSDDQSYLRQWQGRTPFAFVDRPAHRIVADSVVHDDEGGGYQATTHLLQAGHRRIAFVFNASAVGTSARRLQGYRTALAEYGVAPDADLEIGIGLPTDPVEGALGQLLGLADPPTAIFGAASHLSFQLVPWLHARRRTDIGFVSFGDFPMADVLAPSVTVIHQDPKELGVTAVRRLLDRIDNPTRRRKRHLVLPVRLVVRDSTPTLPAPPPAHSASG